MMARPREVLCLLILNQSILPASGVKDNLPNTSTSAANQTASNPLSKSTNQGTKTIAKDLPIQQQNVESQATDLSSMYVQIPIAEPNESGLSENQQQQATDGEAGEPTSGEGAKASTWTGPWPKKFQIGYIKQSDLHQVLIESLRGDSFASMAAPNPPAPAAQSGTTKTSTPTTQAPKAITKTAGLSVQSDSSSLMSPPQPQAPVKQSIAPTPQWPSTSSNMIYGPQIPQIPRPVHQNGFNSVLQHQSRQQAQSMQSYREPKMMQGFPQQLFQHPHHVPMQIQSNRFPNQPQQLDQLNFNSLQAPRASANLQSFPKIISMTGNGYRQKPMVHRHQQFQFPPEFPQVSLKNQPKYSIGNIPQLVEQQPENNPMAMFLQQPQYSNYQQQVPAAKRPKSAEYYSSWKPVPNETSKVERAPADSTQQQQGMNDGFDDEFNTPTKSDGEGSMNRHPMLNSYMNAENSTSAKLSPAMISAKMLRQKLALNGTKTATKGQGSSRSSSDSAKSPVEAAKNGQDLSVMNRRRVNETSTAGSAGKNDTQTMTTQPSTVSDSVTTSGPAVSTSSDQTTTSSATTISPVTTSTMTSDNEATTEPDSEVIDSETTEPSTTTAGASTQTNGQEPQPMTTMASTTDSSAIDAASASRASTTEASEAEVSTLGGGGQSTASLPSVNDDVSSTPQSRSTTTGSSSSTTGTSREETTPVDSSASSTASSGAAEARGESEESGTGNGINKSAANRVDSMSDEALLAAAVRTGSEIGKTKSQQQSRGQVKGGASTTKRARSSERLVQTSSPTAGGRKAPITTGKLAAKTKPPASGGSTRSGKQLGDVKGKSSAQSAAKGSSSKKRAGSAKSPPPTATTTPGSASASETSGLLASTAAPSQPKPKITRMAQQSERLQQQPQIVSMTPAQAQSTAQTLASLLLSRCLQSTNCANLLDVCSTKQANFPASSLTGGVSASELASSLRSANTDSAANATNLASWSMPVGLMSSNLMGLAQALQADKALRVFAQWRETAENIMDHETPSGYTLILPSNDALDRLPATTIDSWLSNGDLLGQIIDAHIIDSAESVDVGARAGAKTRVIRSKGLQINQHRDRMLTVNGKRLVYANQPAPAGGRIHVIDGLFEPLTSSSSGSRQLDIMDTLKQCDKFDGFVTLAEGTGLTQILKQDGPLTVFVPSNEALRKIPDDELEVIKNNSTALREFLMYHVVNGSYFSQDLRDGQQLASILDQKPIQVGVRVDGCSRRLVEANTSPMRRPDIVAKNGVIHILDWYLSSRDNEWCEPITRAAVSSNAISSVSASSPASTAITSSERLQQLASDHSLTYATRMSLPSNHKPADSAAVASMSSGATVAIQNDLMPSGAYDTSNIIVSATPIGVESLRMTSKA